ncbi:MAG: response regulator [Sphingobacteriaceae bacterium]|jgi:DNA-binding response OmpR family regulator|nr:response regulator [Sphingobacteriaceae bacterium]
MPKRILAIDDNPFILEALQDILEFSGYEVATLLDGNLVFETIGDNPPDLILLDVMLGGLDGREICSAIKESDRTQNIPVILISASHNLKDSMHQKGCPDDFVAKPFDIDFLLNKIQSHIKAA